MSPVFGVAAPNTPQTTIAIVSSQVRRPQSTLTLLQANLLVAMLGGFWARQADGHPGPDLMGRGLLILNVLVQWERIRKKGMCKWCLVSMLAANRDSPRAPEGHYACGSFYPNEKLSSPSSYR